MRDVLSKIIELIEKIEAQTNDSELGDCLNEAVMHLESAKDRIITIEEELDTEVQELEI